MNLTMLLDMVVEGMPERVLIGSREAGLTPRRLQDLARAGASLVRNVGADTLIYLGGNGPVFPVALFAASYAGIPFLPVNYRLSDEQLEDVLSRQTNPLIVTDRPDRTGGRRTVSLADLLSFDGSASAEGEVLDVDSDAIAVLLMTSGTTAAPKSAVLRHRHLTSYLFGSVEFMSAAEIDATIVSVPPYHIAAVANLLSNLYAGRRVVYLDHFSAEAWLEQVRSEGVTHAMVVPTMLVRIVEELNRTAQTGPPSLRSMSYGGAKISAPVLVEALKLFPQTGFVNAYGLTETASSIAVLGPEDHREAIASSDPAVRARLSSVGRALPTVEIEIHDDDGKTCPTGSVGNIVVRGPQVAGEYLGAGTNVDASGWFSTRDRGYLDEHGYIYVQGRSDDTIIRGGENIAPAEIEAVLEQHHQVADCAVVGVPDDEWGQRIVAFVVSRNGTAVDGEALRAFAREHLRSSKTPDDVVFVAELPTTPTGKVLRRALLESVLSAGSA